MKKIAQFQITGMTLAGFKSYREPTELIFGPMTTITGGNGRGKTSIADAIAFAVTGLPFFGERGIDKLHNEANPDVRVSLRFVDETGAAHELTRTRRKNRMSIQYDGYEIRQLDLTELFGERDVFLSIFNPLYFIEELGEDGKSLLERHLPLVPHEAVLAQLSEPVRESLNGMEILSPDAFLKGKRAEIRGLEERVIYLTGQKDLAEAQGEDIQQTAADLTKRRIALRAELSALEEKQFTGLDVPALRERMVDLSARYEEALRDQSGDAKAQREHLHALREKIVRRQAEQYHSKYTQALADGAARLKELGAQYRQEQANFQTLASGAACPTCHRPVTEEALPQVRTAIGEAAQALLAAGKEQQAQIAQLQELEKKSRETFEQFKADDLQKWEAEITSLESQARSVPSQAEGLRLEIQALTAELEYGKLTQQEYDRLSACREELRQCEAELAANQSVAEQDPAWFEAQIAATQEEIAALKKLISNVVIYLSKRAELTFAALKMNRVEFSLYDVVKTTGERKDMFQFTYGGRRYDRLSLSEKVRAGLEVSELMKRLTGRNYPVFVDNMESIDDLDNVRPTGQVILAKCVHGAALAVRPVGQAAAPRAA